MPGEGLSIRKVAEEYKVSAMPVREALRQLAIEQALISAAKKAYRVPDLTAGQAADLFFVRSILEGAAAEIATANATKADFKLLEKLIVGMNKYWQAKDAKSFLFTNYQFHSHITSLSGNSALQAMIDGIYLRTGPWLAHGITELVDLDAWKADHSGIVNALRARDAKTVRRLVEEDAYWGVSIYSAIDNT
jgi:DNA-binding GntR family transcriptional regulator